VAEGEGGRKRGRERVGGVCLCNLLSGNNLTHLKSPIHVYPITRTVKERASLEAINNNEIFF
jgi:hypothetical protein